MLPLKIVAVLLGYAIAFGIVNLPRLGGDLTTMAGSGSTSDSG